VSTNVQRLGNLQVHEGCTVYLIERELTTMAELEAIVTDYLQQAGTWGAIPAAGPCCLLAELQEEHR
jgi:hypothetical protein